MATQIPGANFAGGTGGEGGSVVDRLAQAEEGRIIDDSNSIVDPFNDGSLGTYTNTVATGSALRLENGQLSGSWKRERKCSSKKKSVSGKAVGTFQMIRPKAETISGNSIVIPGDVRSYFQDAKNNMICKVFDSDDQKVIQHLLDTLEDKPALLTTNGTPSYNSGNDETTVTLNNPDALDLDMGLTAQEVYDQLRIVPFDYKLSATSDDAATYEEMDLDEASDFSGQLGFAGEGHFSDDANPLTGTCLKSDTVFSENKQYGIRRFMENRSSNEYFVYEYTVDRGKTWEYFGGSKANSEVTYNAAGGNELGGSFHLVSKRQLAVANNGKFFTTYAYNTGSYININARYGDLTLPTPTLTLTPTTGSGAGVIVAVSASNSGGVVAIDKDDMSYVAVQHAYSGNSYVKSFNNFSGTPAYLGGSPAMAGADWANRPPLLEVSGTGTSHRAHLCGNRGGDGYLIGAWLDEATPTSWGASDVLWSANSTNIDSWVNDDYLIIIFQDAAGNNRYFKYKTLSTNAWDAGLFTLTSFGGRDAYEGWSNTTSTLYKMLGQRVRTDPSETKHLFFVEGSSDAASDYIAPIFYEVEDITNFIGINAQSTGNNSTEPFRQASTYQWIGQTFLATTAKCETAVFQMYRLGTIANNYKLWAEIWNTSAGLPSTMITNAVSQDFYPSKFNSSAWQNIRFNFPKSITLTPSATYAIVIKADFPVDASNHVKILGSTASSYPNGGEIIWDGNAWSFVGAAYDLWFQVIAHKITDVGNALHSTASSVNSYIHNFESSIELIDNTNIQFITRRCINCSAVGYHPISGHPYRKIIPFTAGGSVECDTSGELKPVTLNNVFDENLVFNVSLGNPDTSRLDLVTGSPQSPAYPHSQRVGIPVDNVVGTTMSSTVDSDFESGYCYDLADNNYISYGQAALLSSVWNPYGLYDFAWEFEIKPISSQSGDRIIVSGQNSGVTSYFRFLINSSGYLSFLSVVSSTQYYTTANDKIEPYTYHKVRVTRKNGVVKLWRDEGSGWAEVSSYSANGADNRDFTVSGGTIFRIGANSNLGSDLNFIGKIGYAKHVIYKTNAMDENNPFAYDGFKDQSAIVSLQNHGHLISGENVTGDTDDTIANNFDVPVLSSGEDSAIVDSYKQILKYKKDTLSNQGKNMMLKVEMGRGTDNDQSNIEGVLFDYNK